MRTKNTSGFTLIELMIVVAIIAIIASIAIPKLLSARLAANESAAIATLRSISSAQAQLQSSGAIDTDGDGSGEYGFFGELAGTDPMRETDGAGAPEAGEVDEDELSPAVLSSGFGNIVEGPADEGVVVRSGYVFQMWLPDDAGDGVAEDTDGGATAFPDPDLNEILWACYAWPVDFGNSGNRVFFVNQEGDLLQMNNRIDTPYEALDGGPLWDAAFDEDGITDGDGMRSALGANSAAGAQDTNPWTVVQ